MERLLNLLSKSEQEDSSLQQQSCTQEQNNLVQNLANTYKNVITDFSFAHHGQILESITPNNNNDIFSRFSPVYYAKDIFQNDKKQTKSNQQQDQQQQFFLDEHKIPLEQLVTRLETNLNKGLNQSDANNRNQEYGLNAMSEFPKVPAWLRFLEECTTLFSILLWIASVLCMFAYHMYPSDPSNLYLSFVLIFLVLICSTINFIQTQNSQDLMDSFKNFLPLKCTVIRDGGEKRQVLASEITPGDIIEIKMGEKIPADIRIIQSWEMKVDNSALTGESEAQQRSIHCTNANSPLETQNLAFFGTLCKLGKGKGIVIRIGDNTILGQIAKMASQQEELVKKTPLSREIDRFVNIITVISTSLGVLFFVLSYFVMHYKLLDCVILAIGIIVANVPEGMVVFVSAQLAITALRLAEKYVLVKDLEAVETLGATSCICSDKTGTLTQNKMSVEHLWYGGDYSHKADSYNQDEKKEQINNETDLYDLMDPAFRELHMCAVVSSEATFDFEINDDQLQQQNYQQQQQSNNVQQDKQGQNYKQKRVKYQNASVIGDATESALIRFFQPIEDIQITREQNKIVQLKDGQPAQLPFNSLNKFALTIIVNQNNQQQSLYSVLMKGAPEKVWSFCNSIMIEGGKIIKKDLNHEQQYNKQNLAYAKAGERVLGFAIQRLSIEQYPEGFEFIVSSPEKFNFPINNFTFIGLIALIDPPKETVPQAVLMCRSAGVKVMMVTGDQPATAVTIARLVNIIPKNVKTQEEIFEENQGRLTYKEAFNQAEAVVIHGQQLLDQQQSSDEQKYPSISLIDWISKPYCVFARTSPAQKLQIVKACQQKGYIVAVTGDGVNDSPAIKQADIGISMGISGSDVTKDAADVVLLNDDFSSIVDGVEEGRKIFDNLKKTIVYILCSNIVEMAAFFSYIILRIPLPLSCIFMLCYDVGTDILPSISLAYEQAEMDIMTRQPRKRTDHLVTAKMMYHAYGLQSWIQTAGSFLAYFSVMFYFGFKHASLIGMSQLDAVARPGISDYFNLDSPTLGNSNLPQECTQYKFSDSDNVEWLWLSDSPYDLRMVFLKCNQETKTWQTAVEWSRCLDEDLLSPVTRTHVCYSTEALKYAQSAYFIAGVMSQIINVMCVKTRRISVFHSRFNYIILIGQIVEVLICLFLTLLPGVNEVFGGRPLPFFLFMTPAYVFGTLELGWEETRKYLIRNFKKGEKEEINWFERNAYW